MKLGHGACRVAHNPYENLRICCIPAIYDPGAGCDPGALSRFIFDAGNLPGSEDISRFSDRPVRSGRGKALYVLQGGQRQPNRAGPAGQEAACTAGASAEAASRRLLRYVKGRDAASCKAPQDMVLGTVGNVIPQVF